MRSGLATGARLLRRWRTIKRPVFVYPARCAAGAVLLLPLLSAIGLLSIPFYIGHFAGRFFDWMNDSAECAIARIGDWYLNLLETERERRLRFWARVTNGEAPEGWRIDPEHPGRLIKEEDNA